MIAGIGQVIAAAAQELAAAGIDSARVDAELLAAHAAGVDRGRLMLVDADPAFTDRYRDEPGAGKNNEISWVFFCRYTNGTQHSLNVPGEVRIKDDWIDSIGESVSRTYVGRFWRFGELIRQVDAHPEQANDGLKRVLKRLSEEPELLNMLE